MADPVIVACPADTWTKVATAASSGLIHIKQGENLKWSQTYRLTGTAAPTNLDDAVPLLEPTDEISASAPIDVYVYPHNDSGSVRVDL